MSAQERIIKVIVSELEVKEEDVNLESRFIEDLNADSLDMVELIMAFEEEFGIEIPDEDAKKVKTVKDVISYIDEKLKIEK